MLRPKKELSIEPISHITTWWQSFVRLSQHSVYFRNKEKTNETDCGLTRETKDIQTYDVTWREMYSVKC